MAEISIRPKTAADRQWVRENTRSFWGSEMVVVHDNIFYPEELEGFIARQGSEQLGLVTYKIERRTCEIITLYVLVPAHGIGAKLIEAVKVRAQDEGCKRMRLTTTNDNTNALRFYQKNGFRLSALHPRAVERARKIKSEIPLIGEDGIPIRDEIDLELDL
jgi:GNAT superfamily N-acetyltransferase